MDNVLEYSSFKERRLQTLQEPEEQFERVKAEAIAAIATAREKLAAARQRPGGEFVGDFVDGLDRVLKLLDGFDPAVEQDVAQLFRMRDLLRVLFANLTQILAVDVLEGGWPAQPTSF